MMWPFRRKAVEAISAPNSDALWPGIVCAREHMLDAIAHGDWDEAERWVERLEGIEDPRALFPGLAEYIRLEAARARSSVYSWFEPELGRPR